MQRAFDFIFVLDENKGYICIPYHSITLTAATSIPLDQPQLRVDSLYQRFYYRPASRKVKAIQSKLREIST